MDLVAYQTFHSQLHGHPNPFIDALSSDSVTDNHPRRMKPRGHMWYNNCEVFNLLINFNIYVQYL